MSGETDRGVPLSGTRRCEETGRGWRMGLLPGPSPLRAVVGTGAWVVYSSDGWGRVSWGRVGGWGCRGFRSGDSMLLKYYHLVSVLFLSEGNEP